MDEREVEDEAGKNEDQRVDELDLEVVDERCDDQVERDQEQDGRNYDENLKGRPLCSLRFWSKKDLPRTLNGLSNCGFLILSTTTARNARP